MELQRRDCLHAYQLRNNRDVIGWRFLKDVSKTVSDWSPTIWRRARFAALKGVTAGYGAIENVCEYKMFSAIRRRGHAGTLGAVRRLRAAAYGTFENPPPEL